MNQYQEYTVKLAPAFAYEGQEYTEIHFNFGKLTGKDAVDIEEEMTAQGIAAVQNEATDGKYQMIAAAKGSGVSEDVLKALPLKKNMEIKRAARRYMLNAESKLPGKVKASLDQMTGEVAEQVENELRAEGHTMYNLPAVDTQYCVKMAARAADMTEDEILALPMDEYLDVKMAVRFFLLGVG